MDVHITLEDVGLKEADGGTLTHEGARIIIASHTTEKFLNLITLGRDGREIGYLCMSWEGAKKLRDTLNELYPN